MPIFKLRYNTTEFDKSNIKHEWGYVKGLHGRDKLIGSQKEHASFKMIGRNEPSTAIYVNNDTTYCNGNCTINVDLLFDSKKPGVATLFIH